MARVIPITLIIRPDGIDVNPTYANVPYNPGQDVQLRWTIVGSTFPTSGCFAWKGSPAGAPAVSCPSSPDRTIESAVYQNNFGDHRVWAYSVTIVDPDDASKTITIDPEVNNEPPGNMFEVPGGGR